MTASAGTAERTGPGRSYRVSGQLPYGALAWTVCQQAGGAAGTATVWDGLLDGRWASDFYLATPAKTRYSGPAPHCKPPAGA